LCILAGEALVAADDVGASFGFLSQAVNARVATQSEASKGVFIAHPYTYNDNIRPNYLKNIKKLRSIF
jgi:hypothetical protein